MLVKTFPDTIKHVECRAVKEVIKDAFGGVDYVRTEQRINKRDE